MAQFASGVTNPTPVAANTNANLWTLTYATAGLLAQIKMIGWGGQDTSLIAIATQWARVTNTPATVGTTFPTSPANPGATNNFTCQTYSGTAAACTANAYLFRQSWNSQGGGGAIVLPIGGEWSVVSGALGTAYSMIGCGNTTGTSGNLSFDVQWQE